MSRLRKTARERMSEWVLHCAVNQYHIRLSQPTREAALKDACAQLLQGHAVNRIVGPSETITAERVRDWLRKASTLAENAVSNARLNRNLCRARLLLKRSPFSILPPPSDAGLPRP